LRDIDADRWIGSCLETVNPPLWEIGHVGWFQERWCLRESHDHLNGQARRPPADSCFADADRLYHSAQVAHNTRWQLSLLNPREVHDYLTEVLTRTLQRLKTLDSDSPELYYFRLALFHEMMHRESFCLSWQTLGYDSPCDLIDPAPLAALRWLDAPEGTVTVGSPKDQGFVFDNEKWAHAVQVQGFEFANRVVSNGEYAEFVKARGYEQECYWPKDIWRQFQASGRKAPRYWRLQGDTIEVKRNREWVELVEEWPVTHVSLFEAEAWCRWAGCQLPTEAQWLHAAQQPGFEWGEVWEWTASEFEPFVGFEEGPYAEYSTPWFSTHQVLKGASLATPRGLRDLRFRNFYEPERDDIYNGFRAIRPKA